MAIEHVQISENPSNSSYQIKYYVTFYHITLHWISYYISYYIMFIIISIRRFDWKLEIKELHGTLDDVKKVISVAGFQIQIVGLEPNGWVIISVSRAISAISAINCGGGGGGGGVAFKGEIINRIPRAGFFDVEALLPFKLGISGVDVAWQRRTEIVFVVSVFLVVALLLLLLLLLLLFVVVVVKAPDRFRCWGFVVIVRT